MTVCRCKMFVQPRTRAATLVVNSLSVVDDSGSVGGGRSIPAEALATNVRWPSSERRFVQPSADELAPVRHARAARARRTDFATSWLPETQQQ